jgi:hypothetical protein
MVCRRQAARIATALWRVCSLAACRSPSATRLTVSQPDAKNHPPARPPAPGRHHVGTPGDLTFLGLIHWGTIGLLLVVAQTESPSAQAPHELLGTAIPTIGELAPFGLARGVARDLFHFCAIAAYLLNSWPTSIESLANCFPGNSQGHAGKIAFARQPLGSGRVPVAEFLLRKLPWVLGGGDATSRGQNSNAGSNLICYGLHPCHTGVLITRQDRLKAVCTQAARSFEPRRRVPRLPSTPFTCLGESRPWRCWRLKALLAYLALRPRSAVLSPTI